jgi:hypothetical protein
MCKCKHPVKERSYGYIIIGWIHQEVEICVKCHQFRFVQNPLRGWLVLTDKYKFEQASVA